MGPLTFEARELFLKKIVGIQKRVNEKATALNRPKIDILNFKEVRRIKQLISSEIYPNGWDGSEPIASLPLDKYYSDGSYMKRLFYDEK